MYLYCSDLPKLVGKKYTPIPSELPHGLQNILSLSELVLANQVTPNFELLQLVQARQFRIRVRYIIANDGPLRKMHWREIDNIFSHFLGNK